MKTKFILVIALLFGFLMSVLAPVSASAAVHRRHRTKKKQAVIIGGSGVGGAVVGGLAGGKKGALIGAGVGTAAGAIYNEKTKKKN